MVPGDFYVFKNNSEVCCCRENIITTAHRLTTMGNANQILELDGGTGRRLRVSKIYAGDKRNFSLLTEKNSNYIITSVINNIRYVWRKICLQ